MTNTYNFLKPYLRGWPLIIIAMVLSYATASKYLNYVTPMYESTAKLRLADLSEGVPNSNLFKDLDVFATTQKINAEIELLKSQTLLAKALATVPFEVEIFRSGSVRKTQLFENSPIMITPLEWSDHLRDQTFQLKVDRNHDFTITTEQGKLYQGHLGDTISIEKSTAVVQLNRELLAEKKNLEVEDNYLFSILSMSKQISQIISNLDIIAVDKDVPVIRISYKSSHPAKAALFPNALAKAYIEDYIENKYLAANITVNFLDGQIEEISQKLGASELGILGYRDGKSITNIQQETETDLRKIAQLKIQETNIKMNLEAIKDLEKYIQSGKENFLDLAPNFEAFTDLLSTEIVKNIKQLQAKKRDLLLLYTPNDEKVKVIDSKINDLSSYLIESVSNTRRNLQTKYDNLTRDIDNAELAFVDVPEKERMMTILNREFEIYQQSYNFLNQKKIEAEIAKAAKITFHRIITPASVSKEPVSPNRIIIKIVSAILGMMGAIAAIFLVHLLKARVNDLATIESNSMIPIVAAVPKMKNQEEKENFFIKTLAEWEVKDLIPTNSLTCFTGFQKSHGVDFIAQQLDHVLRMQGRSVVLIEVGETPGATVSTSWETILKDEITEKVMIPVELLKRVSTKIWQDFLREKALHFDHVLLVNSAFKETHTIAGMAAADLNIVCLDTRLTPAKLITEVDLMQQEYHLPKVHFVINRVGYNPSFVREIIQFAGRAMHTLKNRKR